MNVAEIQIDQHRAPDHDIEPLIYRRWSPRAMSGESVSEAELRRLFEAARWAPSSFNEQPWRFFWARRDTEHWPLFFDFLMETNQKWAHRASALLVVVAREHFSRNEKPNRVHAFDAGAAWANLALQASSMGLVCHGMGGIHVDRIPGGLGLEDGFAVLCMVAIGRPGDIESLPESLRKQETAPSGRKRVDEFVHEGPL